MRANECEGCGKVDEETVRQCCTWAGNTRLCPSCRNSGKYHVRFHVCGIGFQYPEDPVIGAYEHGED